MICSHREFYENYFYNHCRLNCFIEYLHRKLLTANFLSYDIESAKKNAFIGLLALSARLGHSCETG
jgi:hypothetical protein